ncbi:MAG TPA: PTS sugar transporter subunit IIA [Tissierellaceae bacterium]|nr:PTS sugar transporter subunit IIA [Tissierellaceae bacterium]
MIGVLLVSHGEFCKELLNSAEMIIGKQKNVVSLSLKEGESIENLFAKVDREIERLDNGKGVIILTDLFGGSPSNVAALKLGEKNIESLTGVNLPMLIEVLNSRETSSLKDLAKLGHKSAVDGVQNLRDHK